MRDILMRILRIGAVVLTAAAITAAASVVAAQTQGQAQERPASTPVAIAGKWTMTMEMSMGTATIALEFKQEGEKVTGTYTGSYGQFPLEGVLKARALEFAVYTTIEGMENTMTFSGEVSEDAQTISGSAILGQMGEAGWFAKPAK